MLLYCNSSKMYYWCLSFKRNYTIYIDSPTSILISIGRKFPEVLGDEFLLYRTEICISISVSAFGRTMAEGADRQRTFG